MTREAPAPRACPHASQLYWEQAAPHARQLFTSTLMSVQTPSHAVTSVYEAVLSARRRRQREGDIHGGLREMSSRFASCHAGYDRGCVALCGLLGCLSGPVGAQAQWREIGTLSGVIAMSTTVEMELLNFDRYLETVLPAYRAFVERGDAALLAGLLRTAAARLHGAPRPLDTHLIARELTTGSAQDRFARSLDALSGMETHRGPSSLSAPDAVAVDETVERGTVLELSRGLVDKNPRAAG